MILNKSVVEVLKKAEEKAIASGVRSYGFPHVIDALLDTPAFQSSYTGDIAALRKYVEMAMIFYNFPAKDGLKGYDLSSLEKILENIKKTDKVFPTEEIILAHLFYALCSPSEAIELGSYIEAEGIDIMEICYNLAVYCDIDSDLLAKEDVINMGTNIYKIFIAERKVTYEKRKKMPVLESEPAGRKGKKIKKNKVLDEFCTDLVEAAKKYDKPFIGREDVIDRTIQILCKAEKSNPLHVGEPGVGKSAITKGIAKMILENKVPDVIKDSQLYELDLTSLVAGACFRGDFEGRIKTVLNALNELPKPIVFIDEIHMLIGAGSGSQTAMDAANILKPYLTEGKIRFIGATTYKEYRKYIETDSALMRRFQKIDVKEPSIEDSISILNGLKEYYEKYHKVTYTDEAVRAAVILTAKHIHDRYLPDKAIDLLDEAGAYANVHPGSTSKIEAKNIEDIICRICKVPKKAFETEDYKTLSTLDKKLKSNVFGQEEAINKITEKVQMSKTGLSDETKPIGSFLFVGPSGVGKTELAKQLAEELCMKLIRFDMSEYADRFTSSKLIGSAAGYVGYDDGGLLTNAILQDPNSVLLFDEIEKADPNIFKTFLQMMDYGMLTDNKGRKVDCRQCIIIFTSNAGVADSIKPALGFVNKETVNESAIENAVSKLFPVEFRNRLDAIIKFNGITEKVSLQIVEKELEVLKNKMEEKGYSAEFTAICKQKLVKDGISYEYGARNLQREISKTVKKLFVDQIIAEKLPTKFEVTVVENNYVINKKEEILTEEKEDRICNV